MEKDTIKLALIKYLEEKGSSWTFGGVICRELSSILLHKESVIERHGLRSDLVKGANPIIESIFVPNPNGKGSKVKMYRIKEDFVVKYHSETDTKTTTRRDASGQVLQSVLPMR